ncbi:MAG TPA: cytochrome-c peroxidase [Sandaracinaceae bacterium LLY-WYZ-13_1]|nr:cytochrome-c peroxidase [Sandaracinaceae bacterium LLY-WYZ-13_1]
MAYVGTVSFLDVDGRCVRTARYLASAEQGPKQLVDSMMRDVKQARRSQSDLPLALVQDAAVEMWNLTAAGLKKHRLTADAEMAGQEALLLERLADVPLYQTPFREAFSDDADPIAVGNVTRALAAFQRTLISHDSPYDRLVYGGDESALSDSARRGAVLLGAARVLPLPRRFPLHRRGRARRLIATDIAFHNDAIYNIDGRGGHPADNQGLLEIPGDGRDMGRSRRCSRTTRRAAARSPRVRTWVSAARARSGASSSTASH